jgi:hypothetical protein
MQNSGIKKFFKLYAKEMWELRPEIFIVLVSTLVLNVIFYFKGQEHPLLIGGPFMMVLGLAVLLPFISSFKLLGREWNLNTVYLLLSLPVKGASILGSKLLALLSQYVINTLVVCAGGVILAFLLYPEPGLLADLKEIPKMCMDVRVNTVLLAGFLVFLMSVAGMAYIITISFFSQLLGKLVRRFSGPVTAIVFVATFWLMGKAMNPMWQKLGEYSNMQFSSLNFSLAAFNQLIGINTLIILFGALVVFIAAVLVYNHKIEL